jgi:hypothetical protein
LHSSLKLYTKAMQKLLLFLFLSLLGSTPLLAQVSNGETLYGSYIDLGGEFIHERADQDYIPSISLTTSLNYLMEYSPGSYYPAGEEVVSGEILYAPGNPHFLFKEHRTKKRKKLFPSIGSTFKIGADSFIVANDFDLYGRLGLIRNATPEASILQFMGKTEQFAFFRYTPAVGKPNYVVRRHSTRKLISLPVNRKAFSEKATDIFYQYPSLMELIQQKETDYEQFDDIIQFIRYSDALETGKPIGYTSSWNITDKPEEQVYFARVSRPEKNWKLDIYNQGRHLLFTEHYAYARPSVKEGEAIWYYSKTGIVRKKTSVSPEESTLHQNLYIYHRNGNLHYRINKTSSGKILYAEVLSEEGEPVIDHSGTGTETFHDASSGRTIHREFKNFYLTTSWYLDSQNRKIYQLADKNIRIRQFKSLSKSFSEGAKYPETDLLAGTEGVVLVKLLITPDKQVESYEILQGLSSSIDEEVLKKMDYISSHLKIKSGKHKGEKIFQEVVLPFRFTMLRQASNSYYYDHTWMRQNQIMMQQINMPPPPAPNFSRF